MVAAEAEATGPTVAMGMDMGTVMAGAMGIITKSLIPSVAVGLSAAAARLLAQEGLGPFCGAARAPNEATSAPAFWLY